MVIRYHYEPGFDRSFLHDFGFINDNTQKRADARTTDTRDFFVMSLLTPLLTEDTIYFTRLPTKLPFNSPHTLQRRADD